MFDTTERAPALHTGMPMREAQQIVERAELKCPGCLEFISAHDRACAFHPEGPDLSGLLESEILDAKYGDYDEPLQSIEFL